MKALDSYKQGEKAFYHETGGLMGLVEVTQNKSSKKSISYRLRVLEIINPGERYIPFAPQAEEEFECDKLRASSNGNGLWNLTETSQ